MAHQGAGPTLVDLCFQQAYRVAYRLMRVYWHVRRPRTRGALVAVWNQGELLLVRNSYVPYYSLPGGYLRRNETGRQAAIRELAEEIGVKSSEGELELVLSEINEWEGKRDGVEIFALEVAERPSVNIDQREVIDAAWFAPERALQLELFPPIRRAIELRAAGASASPER
jgi:ADP-ribose pyrophosphatase YjhB (NUDIX family)